MYTGRGGRRTDDGEAFRMGVGRKSTDWGHPDTNGMGRRDCCDSHGLTALRAKKGDELKSL